MHVKLNTAMALFLQRLRLYKAALTMLISSMTGIFNHSVVTVTADITCRVMQSLLQKYLNNLAFSSTIWRYVTLNSKADRLCVSRKSVKLSLPECSVDWVHWCPLIMTCSCVTWMQRRMDLTAELKHWLLLDWYWFKCWAPLCHRVPAAGRGI